MARSSTRSLAGQAAQAARKVVSRRSKATAPAAKASSSDTASKTTAATAPAAKRTVTKKAPAKTVATKTSAAKAPAKKSAAKKSAPASRTSAKTVGETVAKKSTTTRKTAPTKTAKQPAPAAGPAAEKAAARKSAPSTPARKTAPVNPVATKKASPGKPAKKVTATKATADNLAHLPREKAWTKAELAEVVADLHSDRERAVGTLTAQEDELAQLMRDAGDGAGHDQADMGATSFERDQELTVVNNEREKLAQIDRALARIADGTYGTCETCANPIGKGRAMAFPRATLCLACKQREERR